MKKGLMLFMSLCLCTSFAFAGGYQVNLQGQKQSGMGHTGTGLLLDNASVLFNPGAVSFLDSLRGFSIGGGFIFARTTYLEPFPGNYIAHSEPRIGTPFTLYAVYKFKKTDKWNIGLGLYNPYGNKIHWADDWKGAALIREINFKMLFIQPTFSYKLNDKWGIGIGLIYATGNFKLRKAIPVQDTLGHDGEEQLKGTAHGAGFNAGIYFKATEKLSIGIDYRSAVKAHIMNGTADFTVAPSLANDFPNTTFSTTLNMPQMFTLGFGYVVNGKLKLALDINYVGWKSNDSMIIDFADKKHMDVHAAEMYKNSSTYRIGAQYELNEKWTLRLGAYYDLSPVKNGYFTPETPDANKLGITAGASFHLTKKMHVDASILYNEEATRTNNNLQTQFGGTVKTKAVVPGISFEYVF